MEAKLKEITFGANVTEARPSPTVPQLSTLFERMTAVFGVPFPLCSDCLLKKIIALEVDLEDQIVEEVNYSNMLKRMDSEGFSDPAEMEKEMEKAMKIPF